MKTLFKYAKTIAILSLVVLLGCHKDEVPTFPNTRTIQNVINEFAQLEFHAGINDIEMEGPISNTVWRFRVILPADASESNKRPLVICLHGAASLIDPELHTHTDCLEEPGLVNLNPILVCPNSEGFGWFDLPEQEKITNLTLLATQHLPVDEDKIVIMGYSDGGNGAWFYAQYYPEFFSAAIALASSYNPIRPAVSAQIEIPMYVIHGEYDQLFDLDDTQGYVDTAVAAGTDLTFVIADGLEHFNPCVYVPYLMDATDWLENVVWN